MSNQSFYVFSYGSNTLFDRIRERVSSVEVVGTHFIQGFQLKFNKKGLDSSTKANIRLTSNPKDLVWGVVHKIHLQEKPILDRFESLGKGYNLMDVTPFIQSPPASPQAYIANEHQYLSNGNPFGWYLDLVIHGAKENGFPNWYIDQLQSVEYMTDPNSERRDKNQQLLKA